MDDVKKRPFYKSWWFWVLLAVFLIIVVAAASGGDKTSDQAGVSAPAGSPSQVQVSASAPASVPPASPAAVKADMQLGSGYYTSGIDFPPGKYDITAVSGSGNVSSDNMFSGGINSIMGVAEANDVIGGGLYEQTYKNVQLPEGVTLTVDGVKIQLVPSK